MRLARAVVPLFASVASLAMAPAAELSLTWGALVQVRGEHDESTDRNGGDYGVAQGAENLQNDEFDFSVRRARLSLRATYGEEWSAFAMYQADNIDAQGTTGQDDRGTSLRYAYLDYTRPNGDLFHTLRAGLDKAFFNDADQMNDALLLFPTKRASEILLAQRGVGVSYRVQAPQARFGVSLENNTAAKGVINRKEGLWYSARVELAPTPDLMVHKRTESFLGQPGLHLVFGADIALDDENLGTTADGDAANDAAVDALGYGLDVLFHWDRLTVLADARFLKTDSLSLVNGATTTTNGMVLDCQAGWAFPRPNGWVIEPGLRVALIDLDTDADEAANYGGDIGTVGDFENPAAEHGASGLEFDIGCTLYFDGHRNKLQVALTWWEAEAGQADAVLVRIQHGFSF